MFVVILAIGLAFSITTLVTARTDSVKFVGITLTGCNTGLLILEIIDYVKGS